jgi:uncharacterized protein YjiK
VPEPSDIVYAPDNSCIYIISDKGLLCKTDTNGKILATAEVKGLDFEGMSMHEGNIYVTDERTRRIMVYSQNNLELIKQNELSYLGGINLGYEGIVYNAKKGCFIAVTEKDPTWFFELNKDLMKINEIRMKVASDISGLYYHNDLLYALSDEDQMVIEMDPLTYKVIQKWKVPVTNPEGICFDPNGNLVVLSDMEQKIYKFRLDKK